MFDLYTAATPNGSIASIALEALGLPYEVHALRFDQQEPKIADYLKPVAVANVVKVTQTRLVR